LLRRNALEIGWALFTAANLAAMALLPHLAVIPFHFIWIGLMVVYAKRVWSLRATGVVLGAVIVATTVAQIPHVMAEHDYIEFVEVPLMAGVFVVMVTYARRREAALDAVRQAATQQHEFVRDASHQLRTPITIARGHAELLAHDLADGPARDDLDVILGELETLGRLSQNLLTLEGTSHIPEVALQPVEVDALLRRAEQRWKPTANRHWRVGAPEGLRANGDRAQLETALDALIENAVKATRDGDEISLFAHVNGAGTVIEVSDSGPGVPREYAERVFDRFFRLEGPPPGGSGLGLSIVRAVADAHGGRVTVKPSPSGGATFEISLPRRPVAA
jgi:two-component system, OmpR family, sensor kinase